MRRSRILAKVRAGQPAFICSTGSFSVPFAPLAAHYGYDGVWVDAEHFPWDPRDIDAMIARHHEADIDCLWRPGTKEKNALYRLLEDGAAGLMIPHVSTAEQARALVQAVKFPPLGDRGMSGGGRDARYWVGMAKDYVEAANRETFLCVQIETPEAVANAEAIAAVPGVEMLFIGPGDLSLRLGCSPAPSDPAMRAAHEKVAAACRAHGKAWGRPVGSAEDARTIIGQGAQLIAFGSDFAALNQHFASCASHFPALTATRAAQ